MSISSIQIKANLSQVNISIVVKVCHLLLIHSTDDLTNSLGVNNGWPD